MRRDREWRRALAVGALLSIGAAVQLRFGEAGAASSTLYVDEGNPNCSDGGSGSSTQPFCTIGAAASRAAAGQTVAVSPGTYDENVTLPRSGTSTAPIAFVAVDGGDVVIRGGTHGFTLSNRSWIEIDGFTIRDTTDDGIYVSGGSHVTIDGNRITGAGQPVSGKIGNGIRLSGTTDSTVSDNVVDHNSDTGIFVSSGATGVTVTRNQCFENAREYTRAAAGIELYDSDGNVVSFNVAHDNEDSGVGLRGGSSGNLVVGNVVYANGDHGIDLSNASSNRVVSNSVYKNTTSGINAEGSSTSTTLANNVSVDNGVNSPRSSGNIRVDSTATSGTSLDFDLVDLGGSGTMIVWGSKSYGSLASFRSATGQEQHGIEADPEWEAPASGDFHLTSGSPAVDSADSDASGETTIDADGNPRVDDPGTPNTGSGDRPYDDRGAYELQGGSGPQPTPTRTPTSPPGPTPTRTPTPQSPPTPTRTPTSPPGATPTPPPTGGNLVGNSGFESSTSGWSGSGTGVTIARVAGGHSGSFAARLSNDGSAATTCTMNDSPNWVDTTQASSYAGSLWVRADVAGTVVKLRFREYVGGTLVGTSSTQATVGTSWQQLSVVYAPTTAGSTLDFNAYVSSAPIGSCFYADDAVVVEQ